MQIRNNKTGKKDKKEIAKKFALLFLRWLYLFVLAGVIVFAYFVWNKNVQNAEWSDEQKNSYIQKQSVFSFDRSAFQKSIDFYAVKQNRLKSNQKYSGKDIFYPPGF